MFRLAISVYEAVKGRRDESRFKEMEENSGVNEASPVVTQAPAYP